MAGTKNCLPPSWVHPGGANGDIYGLGLMMAMHVWNTICDAGHDPERLTRRFREVGDGTLVVGFFENTDSKMTLPDMKFVIPMGFWHTADGRMPLNWPYANPPPGYGPPGVGQPIDLALFPECSTEGDHSPG